MSSSESNFIDFNFDHSRGSSTVLILGNFDTFQINPFLKKYYGISSIDDIGESQNSFILDNLVTIKKNKKKFSFGFDYVEIDTGDLQNFSNEIFSYNFGEIWINSKNKFYCLIDTSIVDQEDFPKKLEPYFKSKESKINGILFDAVIF